MKSKLLQLFLCLCLASVAAAGVKEDVARVQNSAVTGRKLVAFVFLKGYWDPNCPSCVAQVNATNSALKKMAPTKHAKALYLDPKQLGKEKRDGEMAKNELPECVREAGEGCVVVTDAALGTVVARGKPSADKKENREAEKKLNDACEAFLKTGKTAD